MIFFAISLCLVLGFGRARVRWKATLLISAIEILILKIYHTVGGVDGVSDRLHVSKNHENLRK